MDALDLAVGTRQQARLDGLVAHADAGSQYLAIRCADALSAAGAVASVGSVGDSYDNALAESTIGQIKAELIKPHGPWRSIEQLEFAVFEYLDWWNHRRLHGEIGMIPPAEAEAPYYHRQTSNAETAEIRRPAWFCRHRWDCFDQRSWRGR